MKFETEQDLVRRGVLNPHANIHAVDTKPPHLLVQWNITEKCNLRCSHCYQDSDDIDNDPLIAREFDLPRAMEALEKIDRLLQSWGSTGHINISGGEPLLIPWFWDIVTRIATLRPRLGFSVLSNGSFLDENSVRLLKKLGCSFVQVSLDGTPKVHDQIRGPGNFETTIKAIRLLVRHKLNSMVSFTIQHENHQEFPGLIRICRRLGVKVLWADRQIPGGRSKNSTLLQPGEIKTCFRSMAATRPRGFDLFFNPTTLRMHRALQFHALAGIGLEPHPYSCNAGRGLISLLPDGSLVPCRRMPVVVGNVLTDDLAQVYDSSVLLRTLRSGDSIPPECRICEFAQTCRGGLRCLSYAWYGTPFRADPQCFVLHESLPEREI